MEKSLSARLLMLAGIFLLSAGALAVLFFFAPTQYGFYPRCVLHSLTGLSCPGCGALRATHQLLHGHFKEAFALNPLFFLALPFLSAALLGQVFQMVTGKRLFKFSLPQSGIWLIFAAIVVFTVARNISAF